MKKGYLIFNGGGAFESSMFEADRAWLSYVRGNRRPRVIVVPVAAMEKHQKIAHETARYFKRLTTQADYKLITNQTLANTETEYEILNKVEVIVLSDGSPLDMIERVQHTHTAKALHAALDRKAAVYGTGASAMVLGAYFWFAHEWLPGLGLAPQLAVLPHHNLIAGRLPPDRLLATLPDGITLIGVDQHTNLIARPGDTFEVTGSGRATVYRSVEQQDEYRQGETFALATTGDAPSDTAGK